MGFYSTLPIAARVVYCGDLTTRFPFQAQSSRALAEIRQILESADTRDKSSLPVSQYNSFKMNSAEGSC